VKQNAPIVGGRRGPISAVRPQPRRKHVAEVAEGTPTEPWGSRRLPRSIRADDHRRTLFRSLLRRAEGVPVELPDGETGVVEEIVFRPLGFDFWPVALMVGETGRDQSGGTAGGRWRLPVARVSRIDVRHPRIVGR